MKETLPSFNRNIVECKGGAEAFGSVRRAVLIETLWNVKCTGGISAGIVTAVLIETLWNVKAQPQFAPASWCIVLIETLWNVK